MMPKVWPVLERAVESGVAYGWRRAFKHNDQPGDDAIIDTITEAILHEISEAFDFDDVKNDPAS